MFVYDRHAHNKDPWNKGRLMGQKMPLSQAAIM
jgi:hypothetical protein